MAFCCSRIPGETITSSGFLTKEIIPGPRIGPFAIPCVQMVSFLYWLDIGLNNYLRLTRPIPSS